MKPLIGVTMGDPAGVGPEILVRSARKIKSFRRARVVVFGDAEYLQRMNHRFFGSKNRSFSLPMIDLHLLRKHPINFGKPTAWGGRASGHYIEQAAKAALRGKIDALVTLPINK